MPSARSAAIHRRPSSNHRRRRLPARPPRLPERCYGLVSKPLPCERRPSTASGRVYRYFGRETRARPHHRRRQSDLERRRHRERRFGRGLSRVGSSSDESRGVLGYHPDDAVGFGSRPWCHDGHGSDHGVRVGVDTDDGVAGEWEYRLRGRARASKCQCEGGGESSECCECCGGEEDEGSPSWSDSSPAPGRCRVLRRRRR